MVGPCVFLVSLSLASRLGGGYDKRRRTHADDGTLVQVGWLIRRLSLTGGAA